MFSFYAIFSLLSPIHYFSKKFPCESFYIIHFIRFKYFTCTLLFSLRVYSPSIPVQIVSFPVHSFPSRYFPDSERPSLPSIDFYVHDNFCPTKYFTRSKLFTLSSIYSIRTGVFSIIIPTPSLYFPILCLSVYSFPSAVFFLSDLYAISIFLHSSFLLPFDVAL